MHQAVSAFLLAFPALFSIINPLGGAIIFYEVAGNVDVSQRHRLAKRVALYSFFVMVSALLAGTYILNFFGISMNALRIAGGLVVSVRAYEMLNAPESGTKRKQKDAEAVAAAADQDLASYAFFPLTLPFTTGPGTIAVTISLATGRPDGWAQAWIFYAADALAVLANALVIWICYSASDRMVRILGQSGQFIVSRMVAFLLLGIGVQIAITGLNPILHDAFVR
ncbi:MarC family NAAT transporter [Acidocella facilis]|uniref:MarC family NAAT transporter n=1 Tax=Acidocella facilis TaxID=525 RepID=UPI00047880FB|nr:MarC family NAAT transporter [Acidocella facilis]